MTDLTKDKYAELLQHISNGCNEIGEKRDYVSFLLSMNKAKSISDLITIYDSIYKLLSRFVWKSEQPSSWFIYKAWDNLEKGYVEKLKCFLNENILKWFYAHGNASPENLKLCIANLRESQNKSDIRSNLLKDVPQDDCKELINLSLIINQHDELQTKIELDYSFIREKWNSRYKYLTKTLAGNGRIFDVNEVICCERLGINIETLRNEYLENLKKRKIIEEQIKITEKENAKKDKIFRVICILIMIPVLIFIFWLSTKVSLLTLIILIGLPGALLSYLK